MSLIRSQLIWHHMQGIENAEKVLAEAEAAAARALDASDRARATLDRLKHNLALDRELVETKIVPVECSAIAIPNPGSLIYHAIEKDSQSSSYLASSLRPMPIPGILDASGRMQAAIVKDRTFGHVIRFRADADGPVLQVVSGGDPPSLKRNMMPPGYRGYAGYRDEPDPLYRAGALLEYRGIISQDTAPNSDQITIGDRDFHREYSSLRIIKEDNVEPLPKGAFYKESDFDYTILNDRGLTRQMRWSGYISLEPISGRVVSAAPLCSAISGLPADAESRVQDILKDVALAKTNTVYLSAEEMMVPPEPQVKSAAKKQ